MNLFGIFPNLRVFISIVLSIFYVKLSYEVNLSKALTIRKHLLKMRFERSGRGQEPSRGHKFSILEKFPVHPGLHFSNSCEFSK